MKILGKSKLCVAGLLLVVRGPSNVPLSRQMTVGGGRRSLFATGSPALL